MFICIICFIICYHWPWKSWPPVFLLNFLVVIMASSIACGQHDYDGNNRVVQDGSHTPANKLTDIQPWFIASFDTGHLYLLTSVTWSYCGPKFRALQGARVSLKWTAFSVGLWAHVRLTGPGCSEVSWCKPKIKDQPNGFTSV